jgi:hypothetical protein
MREHGGDARRELAVEDQRRRLRVREEIAQLLLDIAEVDVHRGGADLERRQRALDVLVAVVQVEGDAVARPHAARLQRVREPCGALVELCEGEPPVAVDQRVALRHRVGDEFEDVRELEVPLQALRHGFSLLTIHMAKNCDPPP